jgi:hypothetical protein
LPFYWERQRRLPGFLDSGLYSLIFHSKLIYYFYNFQTIGDEVKDIGVWDPKALVLGGEYSEELKKYFNSTKFYCILKFFSSKLNSILVLQK